MNLHAALLLVVFLIVCVVFAAVSLVSWGTWVQIGSKRDDSDAKMAKYPRMKFERFTGNGC